MDVVDGLYDPAARPKGLAPIYPTSMAKLALLASVGF